jgi:hypothetical protein
MNKAGNKPAFPEGNIFPEHLICFCLLSLPFPCEGKTANEQILPKQLFDGILRQ